MKILTLIIKKHWFDQILSGEKKEETREIRSTTAAKYCTINERGETTGLIKYDAIRFYVGYSKDRASALVAVKGALVEEVTDEQGESVFYEEEGIQQQMINVIYRLGNILEK